MTITIQEITELVDGRFTGPENLPITGAAPFAQAAAGEITYAVKPELLRNLESTHASAVFVPSHYQDNSERLVFVDNPELAFARTLSLFSPRHRPDPGIHPQATVSRSADIAGDVFIGPAVTIGDHVIIGRGSVLMGNSYLGDRVSIGEDALVYPNTTILAGCRIGNRVIIHAGTVIGSDGFGYAKDNDSYVKIPHTGIVQVGDDVEIGAGNTIDRATFGKTWIKNGVKTDNLVHIAHNVVVGENTIIIAQAGIAGSVRVGKNVIIAGQSGISDHTSIGDNAVVGPQSGVAKSVPGGEVVFGSEAMPHKIWLRVQRIMPRLPELKKKIAQLEKQLLRIEDEKR
ncbi:MAG: UDP-3-O-(3-hydroxymyristoyl)glucosamine N-acyltransferase [Desulfobacteraceae bacterium]|nr:UDP-3-O-(3-hydroxymyristoyl)glucosamine N-acyltransferase [Desulfobacteraceae bacterium]